MASNLHQSIVLTVSIENVQKNVAQTKRHSFAGEIVLFGQVWFASYSWRRKKGVLSLL